MADIDQGSFGVIRATSITIQWKSKHKGQNTLPLSSTHQNSFQCSLFISPGLYLQGKN